MSRENDKNQGKRNVESIRTEHESFESEVKRLKTEGQSNAGDTDVEKNPQRML